MADFHILGLARSGTSIVEDYIVNRLNNCGAGVIDLSEFFSPYWYVRYADDGPDMEFNLEAVDSYSFAERVAMFERYRSRHRLVKQIYWLQSLPAIDYCLGNRSANWIIVDRSNTVEHFLSYAIADRYNTWNFRDRQQVSDYKQTVEPFVSNQHFLNEWIDRVKSFRSTVQSVKASGVTVHHVHYDSMHQDCDRIGPALLDSVGLGHCAWKLHDQDHFFTDNTIPTYKKLFDLEEKTRLVLNWRDVEQQLLADLGSET